MTITAALVVFSVTWFLVFFLVLPFRFVSQDEAGSVVPGTPKSAPAGDVVGRKARITTVIALVLSAAIIGVVQSGWITLADIDLFHRIGARSAGETGG